MCAKARFNVKFKGISRKLPKEATERPPIIRPLKSRRFHENSRPEVPFQQCQCDASFDFT